jgi:hypothetical protein
MTTMTMTRTSPLLIALRLHASGLGAYWGRLSEPEPACEAGHVSTRPYSGYRTRRQFQFLCYANENFHDCAHLRWRESKDTKTPFMPS